MIKKRQKKGRSLALGKGPVGREKKIQVPVDRYELGRKNL